MAWRLVVQCGVHVVQMCGGLCGPPTLVCGVPHKAAGTKGPIAWPHGSKDLRVCNRISTAHISSDDSSEVLLDESEILEREPRLHANLEEYECKIVDKNTTSTCVSITRSSQANAPVLGGQSVYYHGTPLGCVPNILKNGLLPSSVGTPATESVR